MAEPGIEPELPSAAGAEPPPPPPAGGGEPAALGHSMGISNSGLSSNLTSSLSAVTEQGEDLDLRGLGRHVEVIDLEAAPALGLAREPLPRQRHELEVLFERRARLHFQHVAGRIAVAKQQPVLRELLVGEVVRLDLDGAGVIRTRLERRGLERDRSACRRLWGRRIAATLLAATARNDKPEC